MYGWQISLTFWPYMGSARICWIIIVYILMRKHCQCYSKIVGCTKGHKAVHVYLCISLCGNIVNVIARLLDAQKATKRSPLSFLSQFKPCFPTIWRSHPPVSLPPWHSTPPLPTACRVENHTSLKNQCKSWQLLLEKYKKVICRKWLSIVEKLPFIRLPKTHFIL